MVHTPPMQAGVLDGHTVPQLPQLLASDDVLTHIPAQVVCPPGHVVDVVLEVVVVVVVVAITSHTHVSSQNVGMVVIGHPVGLASGSHISPDSITPSGMQPPEGLSRRA